MEKTYIDLIPNSFRSLPEWLKGRPDTVWTTEGLAPFEVYMIMERAIEFYDLHEHEEGHPPLGNPELIGFFRRGDELLMLVKWCEILAECGHERVAEDAYSTILITPAELARFIAFWEAAAERKRWEKKRAGELAKVVPNDPNSFDGQLAILEAAGLDDETIERLRAAAFDAVLNRRDEFLSVWNKDNPEPPKV